MSWSSSAPSLPSGSSWISQTAPAKLTANSFSLTYNLAVARLAENKVCIRFKAQLGYGDNGASELFPPPYVYFRVGSSDYTAFGPSPATIGTVYTRYWTGTLASGNDVTVQCGYSSNGTSGSSLRSALVTGPAYVTKYTITYKANGAEGADQTQTKTYGTAVTLKGSGTYSRPGYSFASWNTKADGTGTSYAAGASYSTNASVTLHARWTPQQSLITTLPSEATTQGSFLLQVNRKVSTYWHKAVFSSGGVTLHTSDAFEENLTTTAPRTWFNSFPSVETITVTVTVTTYTDSSCASQVGVADTKTMTVRADDGMVPTVSAGWATAAAYNTGAVSGKTGYIKGYSKAEITFDATKITHAAGATLGSYSVACQGATVSASPYRTPVLVSTAVAVTVTVTDSRGRSTSETLTITVMDYSAPSITNVQIFHCDSGGTADESGNFLSVKGTAVISSLNSQNTATMSVAVAQAGGAYGTEVALTSGTARVLSAYSPDSTWNVRITITDGLGNTAYYYETVPTQKWAMKFRANGSGVGFGKAPEADNRFEIADTWTVKSKGIVDLIYPVGAIYESMVNTSPATLFGGTWQQITGGTRKFALETRTINISSIAANDTFTDTHDFSDSAYAATHEPIAIAGYGMHGSGSSVVAVIRAEIDEENYEISFLLRNTTGSATPSTGVTLEFQILWSGYATPPYRWKRTA